ncbi:FCD domain-containing protein [Streptomyces sp. Y7]|uniref:FCD domain-containing protein n=1 Tax=Streptomyces sp. Y7 TaxID=3342392 RepID=UPI003720AFCE
MSRSYAQAAEYLNREMERESGLRLEWYELLTILADAPDGQVRQQDLLNEVSLSQSGLSRMILRMEQASLVRRLPLADDKRAALVEITRAGRTAIRHATPGHTRRLREQFELLGSSHPESPSAGSEPVDASLLDALAVRDALEPLVLREAAHFWHGNDLKGCRALVEAMRRGVTDPDLFHQANWDLHERLAGIARNPLLVRPYLDCLDVCRREVGVSTPVEVLEDRVEEHLRHRAEIHQELVDAVESRDPERLAAVTRAHHVTGYLARVRTVRTP